MPKNKVPFIGLAFLFKAYLGFFNTDANFTKINSEALGFLGFHVITVKNVLMSS